MQINEIYIQALKEDPFCKLISDKNIDAAKFLALFDYYICLADDILDHKINPASTFDLLCLNHEIAKIVLEHPKFYRSVSSAYHILLDGEKKDLEFVPGKFPLEQDLSAWAERGFRATIAFDLLCHIDPSFRTEENKQWVLRSQTKGLIHNDVGDILTRTFEDLYQQRRNYVLLARFDSWIYYNWRGREEELIDAARDVKLKESFDIPKDERLIPVFDKITEISNGML